MLRAWSLRTPYPLGTELLCFEEGQPILLGRKARGRSLEDKREVTARELRHPSRALATCSHVDLQSCPITPQNHGNAWLPFSVIRFGMVCYVALDNQKTYFTKLC